MLFSKKWIALSLTAAMIAANLTMPVTSLSVMGADISQEGVADSAGPEEDSAVEPQESIAAESAEDDISDEQEISSDNYESSEYDDQESEAFENPDMSEEENGKPEETDETGDAREPEQDSADTPAEEEIMEDPSAGQDQAETDSEPGQEVQAGPEEEEFTEEAVNSAQAAADSVDESRGITAEPMTEIVIPAEDCCPDTDNNDVFAGYVNRELELENDLQFDTGDVDDVTVRMEKAFASTRLTGNNRTVYAILLREIKKVAAGERSDTEFTVTLEDLGLNDQYWTAADLGVNAITQNGKITREAMQKLNDKLNISFLDINRSLLADCPYDLYWYDKTIGSPSTGFGYQTDYVDGECVLMFSPDYDYTFSFPVEAEYSASGQEDTYEVNPDIGSAVKTAYDTAQSIVSRNASKSDFEKMKAYKDEICDLVNYNYAAADGNFAWNYGNPWQLVWVFDNDASSKVVCEGYSKSFQYLCDLTSWNDIFKECISVTGVMDGGTGAGGHMWNIVTLRNGKNYMVDVTNCDDGSIGDGNGCSDLFLVGTGTDSGSTVYAQGNVDDGYYFPGLDNLIYAYNSDARTRFGDDVLTLSAGKVSAGTTADGSYPGDHTHIYAPVPEAEATCTEDGHSAAGQCSICGEFDENYESYPAKGHTPGNWTVSREPSYDEEGEETTTCTVCGSKFTRPVDKLVSETGITLEETEAIIETGSTKQLSATVLPADAHDKTVTWSSSNTAVAAVTSDGLVTAAASGTAVITAQTSHLGLTATCQVVVNDPVLIDINEATVSGVRSQTYNGKAITPNPVVKMGSVTLVYGTDYDLSYSHNTDAGRGTINIIGMGQYTNVKKVAFAISPAFISNVTVKGITDKTYDGSAQTQDLVLEYNSITLTKNIDYTLIYERNINVGTARILISGRDNFTGTALKSFQILPKSIENDDIDDIPAQTYTGDACEPSVTVTVNNKALTPGTDFTVSYSSNIDPGAASVIITGRGNYTGTIKPTFIIYPVGWYPENDERYYYKEDGSKLTNGWAKDGKDWYWLDADGKITRNKWVKSAGKWYYMSSSGVMATGWQKIGGKWYYMNSSGVMTTGWQKIEGRWYYMDSSGVFVKQK